VSVAKGYLGAGEFELYRMTKWHPAEDAPDGAVGLVAFKPYGHPDKEIVEFGLGRRDEDTGCWEILTTGPCVNWSLTDEHVVGWMPLPEPPKEKVT
jgi:hypothetical protein